MRLAALSSLIALSLAPPVFAAATPWQTVSADVRLRLISSDVLNADGTTLVGLEIDMPPGYRTYWRHPGESGIPTQIDTGGSSGIGSLHVDWPFPAPEVTQGYLDYVYHGPTVLPATVKPIGSGPVLAASVVMGVCAEVCVPVQAAFRLPLGFAAADPAQSIRLQQAEATVPIPWAGPEPAFGPVSYDAKAKGLTVPLGDPAIDPASVIASAADPNLVFGTPQKSLDGRSIFLALRDGAQDKGWLDAPVELTFMTPDGPYQVSLPIAAAK